MRVYHHESRVMIHNFYLKQKLESLLLDAADAEQFSKDYRAKLEFEDQEEQRIFDAGFDERGRPIRRKRRRTNNEMFGGEGSKAQKTVEK